MHGSNMNIRPMLNWYFSRFKICQLNSVLVGYDGASLGNWLTTF